MSFSLLVVIHETMIDAEQSIRLHGDSNYYASYHCLIHRNGFITYLTPADSKAYAAANSKFTNLVTGEVEHVENSVNDFAYHIALESPPSDPNDIYHIGYTKEQYKSLAWLIKASGVSKDRITTHGEITDPPKEEPRCLNLGYLSKEVELATNKKSINFGILDLDIL